MIMDLFLDWASQNRVELLGTVFGLVYVWFSIRQSLLTWPAGIITSALYVWVFLTARLYAEMTLQLYYMVISVYGWWRWKGDDTAASDSKQLSISRTSSSLWQKLFALNICGTILFYLLLKHYTDSHIPLIDGLITSMSFIATWMLTQKKLEHWLLWIFIDLICVALYFTQGLYPSVFLFFVYMIMAILGFYEWRKQYRMHPDYRTERRDEIHVRRTLA